MKSRLQYISQGITLSEQKENIRKALDHGAEWIQVRWKNATEKELWSLSEITKSWCTEYGALCMINDNVHVAKETDADGVHLGLTDGSVRTAREILGKGKIIGGTANTLDDVIQRTQEGCDYIGLGPFQFTLTKSNLSPILGTEGYLRIIQQLEKAHFGFPPIYAIGGIDATDIKTLMNTGIFGIALSGIITRDPQCILKIKKQLNDYE